MTGKAWNILKTERPHKAREGPSLPTTVNTSESNSHAAGFSFQYWKRTSNTTIMSRKRRQNYQSPQEINNSRVGRHQHLLVSSARRRASAALLSIFICTTILIYIIPLFSAKLHTIESQLANQNGLSESTVSSQSASGISTGSGFHPGRRLFSTQDLQSKSEMNRSYPLLALERVRQNAASVKVVLSLLKDKYWPTNRPPAFLGAQLAYISPLTALPKSNGVDEGCTTVISVYHVRNAIPEPRPTHPLPGIGTNQKPQRVQPVLDKTRIIPISPGIAQGLATHQLTQRPPRPKSVHSDPITFADNEVPRNPLRTEALKKGQETNPLMNAGKRSKDIPRISKSVNRRSETRPTQLKKGEPKFRRGTEPTSLREGMIEIWMLHSGNSICRIYNVGRLPGGKMLLPEWMKKHSMILLHQCGVKDPIYAIKSSSSKDKKFVFDKKRLNMTGRVRVIDHSNMDLLGANAPRHHMPHFVSDILFPLRAVELFKGSGNGIAKLSTIRSSSPPNSSQATRPVFTDIKPSLFLRTETWQASPSTWVQKLAKFFLRPTVGFTFLSEEEKRRPKQRPHEKSNAIWRFRSVLSDNLDLYEGEGLFDLNGNNFVFSRNGLSGAPAWTIKGISKEPCRVSVTALTRTGPRALLHLDVLKKVATKLFASRGLVLDFRAVKFDNAAFETQVKTMRGTNVLIATHGAGNTNVVFMRRGATVIEVFPFAYRAGPFDGLARIFGLDYKAAMSAPQTKVFKECMEKYETKDSIKDEVFEWWDKAVAKEKVSPWVHRLELEKEFGEPGKSEGMATRRCVRMQQLAFDTKTVAAMAFESAKRQCNDFRFRSKSVHLG